MVKNPTTTAKSRHIYVKELVNKWAIRVYYIPANLQFVDEFTKNLSSEYFRIRR